MGIFTPKNKFMEMMKTTLNTNKYFIENKKEEDKMAEYATIKLNDTCNSYMTNTITDKFEELNDKYDECISFSEQQIKLNKQLKNNCDRFNKNLRKNTDDIVIHIDRTYDKLYEVLDNQYRQELIEIGYASQYKDEILNEIRNIKKTVYFFMKVYGILLLATFLSVCFLR